MNNFRVKTFDIADAYPRSSTKLRRHPSSQKIQIIHVDKIKNIEMKDPLDYYNFRQSRKLSLLRKDQKSEQKQDKDILYFSPNRKLNRNKHRSEQHQESAGLLIKSYTKRKNYKKYQNLKKQTEIDKFTSQRQNKQNEKKKSHIRVKTLASEISNRHKVQSGFAEPSNIQRQYKKKPTIKDLTCFYPKKLRKQKKFLMKSIRKSLFQEFQVQ